MTKEKERKKKEIEHIAHLSRLQLSDDEADSIFEQIEKIIEYFSKLSELNLEKVEPTSWTVGFSQRLREDLPQKFENPEKIVELFPASRETYVVVPPMIEDKKKKS